MAFQEGDLVRVVKSPHAYSNHEMNKHFKYHREEPLTVVSIVPEHYLKYGCTHHTFNGTWWYPEDALSLHLRSKEEAKEKWSSGSLSDEAYLDTLASIKEAN